MGPHKNGKFFTAQALTSIGTVNSDTVQGDAEGAEVEIQVNTAFTTAAAGTLQLALMECATVGGSYTEVLKSKVYAVSELTKSAKEPLLRMAVPRDRLAFLRLDAIIATGAMTAGKIDAYLINRQL